MEGKKTQRFFLPIGIILFLSFLLLFPYIRDTYRKNIILSAPDSYCIYSGTENESDLQFISLENGKHTYHISTLESCLSSQGSYVYITGSYWNSLTKPIVYINNEKISVKTSGTGYSVSSRLYHFYIHDVVADQKYTIKIECGDKSEYINVFFNDN